VYFDYARFVETISGGSGGTSISLVFANYESGLVSPINLGGAVGGMSPDGNDPVLSIVSSPVQEGSKAFSLGFNYSVSGGWCGIWQQLTAASGAYDVSAYDTYKLYVAGKNGGEKFKIEMKDTNNVSFVKNIADIAGFSGGLSTTYQEISIPLSDFTGVDMSLLKEINYVFDQLPNGSTVYIDNVRFTGTIPGGQTTVTVTVKNYTVSVEITGSVSLGELIVGTTGYSPLAVSVKNNGNISESFWLSLTNPSGWTSGSSAGANQFVLMGAFDAAGGAGFPWNVSNHALTTSPAKSSATRFAGSQSGLAVPINDTRSLWFAFGAPTTTTVETAQTIPVTITAEIQQ